MPLNYILDDYKKGTYPYPDADNTAPKDKRGYKYILETLKAIYSAHAREKTAITPTMQDKFVENRLYGKGKQPDTYYRKILINDVNENVMGIEGGRELAEQRRKSWQQLDFDHKVTYAPKVEDHFWSMYMDSEKDVIGHMIDKESGMEMKSKKLQMLAELKFYEELSEFREMIGEKEQKYDFFPMDKAELDLYESSGGFKLNYTKSMEQLLKQAFEVGDWKNLGREFLNDALHTGYIMGKVGEDINTNETVPEYCDPEFTIVQHSNYWDFRDIEFAAPLKPWTINSLKKYVKKEELIDAVKKFAGKMGNPGEGAMWNLSHNTDLDKIGHYKVMVMEGYYIDYEDNYRKEYVNPYQKKRLIDVPYGYEPKNNNEKIKVVRKRYVYTGKWVVGTDILFDYGRAHDQLKDGKEVSLPFKVFKVADKPPTERLIPFYDQLEIGWLRFQNSQAQASTSGNAINMRLLGNAELGGKPVDGLEALKFMKETGDVIFSDTDLTTAEGYRGGSVSPVHPIEGGMRNDLQEGIQKFQWTIQLIEQITGMSNVSMGAQPEKDTKVGNTQMAVEGSYSIIQPVLGSVMNLKGSLAREMMFDIQLKIRDYEDIYNYYADVIGEEGVEAILMATKRGARFGVHFEARATKQQKSELYQLIQYSLTAGKNGTPLLRPDEAWIIYQGLVTGGNVKKLGLQLSYMIRKREEELTQKEFAAREQAHRQNMEQSQQNFQQNAQLEKIKGDYQLQEEQMQQQGETKRKEMDIYAELKQTVSRLSEDMEKLKSEERLGYAKLLNQEKSG